LNGVRYAVLAAAALSGGALGATGCGKVSRDSDSATAGSSTAGSGTAGNAGASILGVPVVDGGAVLGDAGLQATIIATSSHGITGFAIDATNVYFTVGSLMNAGDPEAFSYGTVSKCPLSGCTGSPTVIATGQNYPQQIAINGSALYWFNYNAATLMRCALNCADDATPLFTLPELQPLGFAVTANSIFFTSPYAGLVEECSAAGCADAGVTLASGQLQPTEIATDGTELAWSNWGIQHTSGLKNLTYSDGGVLSCPVAGCDAGVRTLSSLTNLGSSVVVESSTVYWYDAGSILSCPATGCSAAPQVVVAGLPQGAQVGGLSLDTDNIYFSVDNGEQQVERCALTGCPNGPTVLASIPTNYQVTTEQTAVDATRVYFIVNYGTQILALTK